MPMANEREEPLLLERFSVVERITLRWADNDQYGHVNNAHYYFFFDTAVNNFLQARGAIKPKSGEIVGLVVASQCQYFRSLAYPGDINVAVGKARIGRTSVTYRLSIFDDHEPTAAAQGYFTHVYVDPDSRKPVILTRTLLEALNELRTID
ncbi:acyl-CoA thioesterase [Paraburkholderia caledonica]|uniref:acyl-CoA thioesterase n=1 Tax=Paraburkholderia caledonica TaxID=134536 RepID=UPI000372960E|nr:thioesterase family protein [Paraburkholderia caledonica]